MKLLRKILFGFIYILPAILFFSYHPVLRLGQNSSMNFELSLPLIWLVLFDLFVIITLVMLGIKHRASSKTPQSAKYTRLGFNFPGISDRRIFLLSLFPFFATLSIFWSENPVRAFLTAGIIWLLFLAVFALLYLVPLLSPPKDFSRRVLISFFASSLLVCIFCWLQSCFDIFAVDRAKTLLCLGCTYHSFGFPHPSGFAIEPQFMGNLLLAPTLAALYLLVFHHPRAKKVTFALSKSDFKLVSILAAIFSATLFLTFSRGAIYAYFAALLVLLGFSLRRSGAWHFLLIIPAITFTSVLGIQGLFSALGPTNETFISGVTKSIHHLSLGLVDLRPNIVSESVPESDIAPADDHLSTTGEEAIFEGYVAESTDVRLNLNQVAFETWSSSPRRLLFGVGLGGAGTAMHRQAPQVVTSPKEIVQNEACSLLLELGIIGVLLALLGLLVLFSLRSHFWSSSVLPLLVSLLFAYFVTLNFFSGLPNALQIYLMPPLLYLLGNRFKPLQK